MKRIYTIWPSDKDGNPGGDWRQQTRYLVLDVTDGIDNAILLDGPISRADALKKELDYRTGKERNPHE